MQSISSIIFNNNYVFIIQIRFRIDSFFKDLLTFNVKSARETANTATAKLQRFECFLRFWLTWAFVCEAFTCLEGKYTLNYQCDFHSICQLWIIFSLISCLKYLAGCVIPLWCYFKWGRLKSNLNLSPMTFLWLWSLNPLWWENVRTKSSQIM